MFPKLLNPEQANVSHQAQDDTFSLWSMHDSLGGQGSSNSKLDKGCNDQNM
jgi:hypothetical protein